MTTRVHDSQHGWRYAAIPWLALGLFDATQTVVSMRAMGMHHAWWTLFFTTLLAWAPWCLFTPAVLALLHRFALPARAPTSWAVHGAACLAAGVLWSCWAALLEHAANPFAWPSGPAPFLLLWEDKFLSNLVGDFILYGAIVALSVTVDARQRLLRQRADSARVAELLAQAQLAALRLQIEPHFLFNALNAVTGLIRANRNDDAVDVVAALGDLLRRVTDRSDLQFVTVEDEVEFLQKYLDIQRYRYAERLVYRIDIPPDLMRAQVPDFILQPLVENAIKHGVARRARGGRLRVSAARAGAVLTLSVHNDGPGLPAQVKDGVGLANTRQRLLALYGDAQALQLQDAADGVLATIALPYREARQ